jgi:hypothetical protein
MCKDNFANCTAVGGTHIVRMIFLYLIGVGTQPIFAVGIAFTSMNMLWFISLIGIKEKPLTTNG